MKKRLFIEGMTCQHCVGRVTKALEAIPGVLEVAVDLKGKFGDVEMAEDVDASTFKKAIDEAGYDLTKIE